MKLMEIDFVNKESVLLVEEKRLIYSDPKGDS